MGKTVSCPECGKVVSLKGFAGHMRFKHEASVANAKELTGVVKNEAVKAGREDRLYELMDLLAECRARKDRVGTLLDDAPLLPLFSKDEALEGIERGLKDREKKISAEIASLVGGTREEAS